MMHDEIDDAQSTSSTDSSEVTVADKDLAKKKADKELAKKKAKKLMTERRWKQKLLLLAEWQIKYSHTKLHNV